VTGNSQWSLGYSYDSAGNLISRTDARGVTTTYAYDGLNRNTTVDYSDTPAINPDLTRVYDNPTGGANGKGRFWYDYAGGNYSVTLAGGRRPLWLSGIQSAGNLSS
jgi:YD repeat-containing protein